MAGSAVIDLTHAGDCCSFNTVDDTGREALIELCGSISECEAAAKVWLDGLVGGDLASSATIAALRRVGETGGASGGASGTGLPI